MKLILHPPFFSNCTTYRKPAILSVLIGSLRKGVFLWKKNVRRFSKSSMNIRTSIFQLKELEKLGPKKGVITQSVKDVVQSLVDDDLVLKDKIGTSVYFWSLPSSAGNQLRNVHRKLDSDLHGSRKRYAEAVDQFNSLKKGREDSDDREEALTGLKAIELKYNKLKEEMGQFADNDPATFVSMKKAIEVCLSAANRWTDNIFTLRQWCSNNFPEAKEQLELLYKEFGITDDFEYMELPTAAPVAAAADATHEDSQK